MRAHLEVVGQRDLARPGVCTELLVLTRPESITNTPVQPSNVFCSPGTAESVTTVPTGNVARQTPTGLNLSVVQLIPAGLEVTVPALDGAAANVRPAR